MRGMHPLEGDELARIDATFAGPWAARDRLIFVLIHRAGFRASEARSLRIGAVLADPASLRPDRPIGPEAIADDLTVTRRNMKGRREGRTVPVHLELRLALVAWLEDLRRRLPLRPDLPLFLSRKRASSQPAARLVDVDAAIADVPDRWRALSRQQLWRIIRAACRRAQVYKPVGLHGLRKTFGERVLANARRDPTSEPLLIAQEALGHKSLDSTRHYLAVKREKVKAAILG